MAGDVPVRVRRIEPADPGGEPICLLTAEGARNRRVTVDHLLGHGTLEFEGAGYEIRLPPGDEYWALANEFADEEAACCSSLAFDIYDLDTAIVVRGRVRVVNRQRKPPPERAESSSSMRGFHRGAGWDPPVAARARTPECVGVGHQRALQQPAQRCPYRRMTLPRSRAVRWIANGAIRLQGGHEEGGTVDNAQTRCLAEKRSGTLAANTRDS